MTDTPTEYDLIVIGAGPAGSAAAYFASRAGLKVLFIDQRNFPRHKICSGGLSPKSLVVLEMMGILEQIKRSDHPMIRKLRLGSPNGTVLEDDLPITSISHGYGYVVPRFYLDDMLRIKAVRQGATFRRARVNGLLWSNGNAEGIIADGCEIRSHAIIVAGGARPIPTLDSRRMWESDVPTFHVIQTHYEDPSQANSTAIEIYFEKSLVPGYFWIFPEGRGRLTVGAGVWGNSGGARDLQERYENGIRYVKEVCQRVIPASDTLKFERWIIPAHRQVNETAAPNVLLAGDAGGFANPFTGEGIYYALETGRLASEAVAADLKQTNGTHSLAETYAKLLTELVEELKISWSLHDLMSDAKRVDVLISDASQDKALRKIMVGAVINALDKSVLTNWLVEDKIKHA